MVTTESYSRSHSLNYKQIFEGRISFQNLPLVLHQYPIVIAGLYINPRIPVSLTEVEIQHRSALKKYSEYKPPKSDATYNGVKCKGFIPVAIVRGHLHELERKKKEADEKAKEKEDRAIQREARMHHLV